MDKTVVVSLYGGLGNQLFQYATAYALAHAHQAQLLLDLSWFDTVKEDARLTNRSFALSAYQLSFDAVSPISNNSLYFKIARKFFLPIKDSTGIPIWFEKHFHFDAQLGALTLPVHLDGYWQSFRYFESVKPQLVEQLTLKHNVNVLNQEMFQSIKAQHSVCVHIRRGDYVSNPSAAAHHGTCSLAYYHQAIERMRKRHPSSVFCIFSDDIAWAKEHLKTAAPHTYVDINSEEEVHLDLWLMRACRDFILANSSLSWWAAWLCDNPTCHVIVPDPWFASNKHSTQDLIPAAWERLSVFGDQ